MIPQNINHKPHFKYMSQSLLRKCMFIAFVVTEIQAHTSDAFLSEITVGNSIF